MISDYYDYYDYCARYCAECLVTDDGPPPLGYSYSYRYRHGLGWTAMGLFPETRNTLR